MNLSRLFRLPVASGLGIHLFFACHTGGRLFAASDVTISAAATSGGEYSGTNPAVFTPAAAAAVASRDTIQTRLDSGQSVTINTASTAGGSGDLTVVADVTKSAGGTGTLRLNADRDLVIQAPISSATGELPLILSAGRDITNAVVIASNGGDITLLPAQKMTLGAGLNAAGGQILVQSGSVESAAAHALTAGTVQVSAGAALRVSGVLAGSLVVAGSLSPMPGEAPGYLSVGGDLTLQSTATTRFDLAGTGAGSTHDALYASGNIAVAGALQVNLDEAYWDFIAPGDFFIVMQGTSLSGFFAGYPDGSRYPLPNDLGSLRVNYTETSVFLDDWQPRVTDSLTWDAGTADAGTQVFANTNTRRGRHYFRLVAQDTDIGAWRSRLVVNSGEADLFMATLSIPTPFSYHYESQRVGSDGFVLRSDQYAAAEEWFLMVVATSGAHWTLCSGRAFVQDLGTLGFTDSNGNAQYDIGEPVAAGGSGVVPVGPEGMRFFKAAVPVGTPAWSLWLHGDTRDLALGKASVPFPIPGYFDRQQAGQMLVVPPVLGTGSDTYFLAVSGDPGDSIQLDSRIQFVTDIAFASTTANQAVSGPPYRVFRTQVPIDQIAWDVSATANSGNPNVAVRQGNVPAEFDNEAFSEAPGSVTDSVTLVPDFLADGTWFITVYGTGSYNFTLRSGNPVVTPIAYTDLKVNDQPNRAGWRFYVLPGTSIPDQLGTLGWELLLSNQAPGARIALRRNAVPGRWQYRSNGQSAMQDTEDLYTDYSGRGGFLQRPGHQADVWYIGIFTPNEPLGAFTLDVHPLAPTTVGFNGSTTAVTGQEPGRWKFSRVEVPAGVAGWDVRVRDVSGGTPQLVVRRDLLPLTVYTSSEPGSPYYWNYIWYPQRQSSWASGYQWTSSLDWTGRTYDDGSSEFLYNRRMVMGMGRTLETGTYYVGVYNAHATEATSYTLESRGIGTGQVLPVTDLSYTAGSNATISNLAPREAKYFKVTIPPNTPSWEITLDPTQGEMMLAVRRGAVPDFELRDTNHYYGYLYPNLETPQFDPGDREVPVQKDGAERYLLLPRDGEDFLAAGDYYLAVIGEGQNPEDAQHTGTGTSSGVLTSRGALAVVNLGTASLAGLTQAVDLAAGQVKAYEFTVPAGTASLEVRLDSRVGNPGLSLVPGTRTPTPFYNDIYGIGDGQTSANDGVDWQTEDNLITLANPPAGTYRVTVRAAREGYPTYVFPEASADLVVIASQPVPVPFNGGGAVVNNQPATAWSYFQVTVPPDVVGWDIRLKDVSGGTPQLVVRRDQLPTIIYTSSEPDSPNPYAYPWYPQRQSGWTSGSQWTSSLDWTGRTHDDGSSESLGNRRMVTGMGRPLEPGTYYVGVHNAHATDPARYTLESRGIGTGQVLPVTDLSYTAGSNATISNLAPREAKYFKVTIPPNTPSWEITLDPTQGEMMLAVRRGAVPDFELRDTNHYYGYLYPNLETPQFDPGDREVPVQKDGAERYLLLPRDGEDFLAAGDYYLAVIGEGQNPEDAQHTGTGTSSGVLTSRGALAVVNLGTASLAGLTQAVDLAAGQVKAYEFTVPAGTASLEVRLDSRVGNPGLSLVPGTRTPTPFYNDIYGIGDGQTSANDGVDWQTEDNLITLANPPAGTYRVTVRAAREGYPTYVFSEASADLVVIASQPVPVPFNGGGAVVNNQPATAWSYFQVTVPPDVVGWDIRLKDVSGGTPQLVVRRDQLPTFIYTSSEPDSPNPYAYPWYPQRQSGWTSGSQWTSSLDWTGRTHDDGSSESLGNRRMVTGMGRPLEPGTYYVGVHNAHATDPASYTLESRGIGTGQVLPVTDLSYTAGSNATISNLAPREAKYFKVTIPSNTPSWEITLDPTQGEMMLAVRRGAVPDFELRDTNHYYGYLYPNLETPQFDPGDREVPVQKDGAERYLLLPRDGEDFLAAGDYYLAVIGEGQNPEDAQHTGTGTSSGVLTSRGALAVVNLGTASLAGLTQAVDLAAGQVKAYEFTVPAGAASLEVRLDNRVGRPALSLVPGTRTPTPFYEISSLGIYGYGIGDGQTSATGGVNWQGDDNLITLANPPAGTYRVTVRAAPDFVYPTYVFSDASADVVIRTAGILPLNYAAGLNGNGLSNVDSKQLLDSQAQDYSVDIPLGLDGQPVVGWVIRINPLQGATTLRISRTFGDADGSGITVSGNTAVIVPPYLTPGETWYIRVQATGLTQYEISSHAIVLERPVWTMPLGHNSNFGDSGLDSLGAPLPGDQGVDIGQDDWHFFAIDVPEGNGGLLRTELQAINGNPNLHIREDGVPTTDHDGNGDLYAGELLVDRSLTSTASEYGNWVPLDGRSEKQLRPGRWYLGVKAAGGTNARYRLKVSNGQVSDLALSGGSTANQLLVGRDWRYYRFTVPVDAPLQWDLTFSQQVGDVVMWIRDTIPPGNNSDGLETQDFGREWYYYGAGLRSWHYDQKNQGPYGGSGHDAAGTYTFNTPSLRPGSTYYAGFRANNDATFSLSSATSGGSIGVPPTLDFYAGTLNTVLPASGSVLYRIPAPAEATRLKWTATLDPSVELRLEQGTLPGLSGNQHWTGNGVFNQSLSHVNWPWQPARDYYLRLTNTSGAAQPVQLNLLGANAATEDEDEDSLPDHWETAQYTYYWQYGSSDDPDADGHTNAQEWLAGTHPTDNASVLRLVPDSGTPGLIHIPVVAGKSYTVDYLDQAPGATWTRLLDIPLAAATEIREVQDPGAAGVSGRLYRVVTPVRP